jgi:hypothetical protein
MNLPSQTLELGIIPQWKANRNPAWFRVVTDGVGRLILRREDAKIQTQGHQGIQIGTDRDRGSAFFDPLQGDPRHTARVANLANNPEVVMRLSHRLVLALLIVLVDTAAFLIPLTAVLVAYILLARPAWFRDWVDRLYRGAPR